MFRSAFFFLNTLEGEHLKISNFTEIPGDESVLEFTHQVKHVFKKNLLRC